MNAILIGRLATCVGAGKHPVEETTRRLRLLRRLVVVVDGKRVLQPGLCDRCLDMYKGCTLVVAVHDSLGGLIVEARWRGCGGDRGAAGRRRQ